MNKSRLIITAYVLGFVFSTSADAIVIFDQTQTGAELFANSDVSFPNSPINVALPTVNGTALNFDNTANGENSVRMRWDLLPTASREDLTITVFVDYTALTVDNDPIFAIQSGSNFLGAKRSDNGLGIASAVSGPINTTVIPNQDSAITSVTMISTVGIVDPMSWALSVPDGATDPQKVFNFTEGTESAAGPFFFTNDLLDSDDALFFALVGNWFNDGGVVEEYELNSVRVVIDASVVPIPSAFLLFGSGLLGLASMAGREKVL